MPTTRRKSTNSKKLPDEQLPTVAAKDALTAKECLFFIEILNKKMRSMAQWKGLAGLPGAQASKRTELEMLDVMVLKLHTHLKTAEALQAAQERGVLPPPEEEDIHIEGTNPEFRRAAAEQSKRFAQRREAMRKAGYKP